MCKYQATIGGFVRAGIDPAHCELLIRKSVVLAKSARDAAWTQIEAQTTAHTRTRTRPLVAASIGSYGASLADGSEYRGDFSMTIEELKDFHRARWLLLGTEAPDVYACETVPCLLEVEALLQLMLEPQIRALGIPAWIAVSCKDGSSLNSGEPLPAFADLVKTYGGKGADLLCAVGINCTPPHYCREALNTLAERCALPLVVYANMGESWDAVKKEWMPDTAYSDRDYAAEATNWCAIGGGETTGRVRIVGGCCRTRPSTIAALRKALC